MHLEQSYLQCIMNIWCLNDQRSFVYVCTKTNSGQMLIVIVARNVHA